MQIQNQVCQPAAVPCNRDVPTPVDSRSAVVAAQRRAEREAQLAAQVVGTPLWKRSAFKELLASTPGVATETQCSRVLRALKLAPTTRMEFSRHLDVQHAAARILQLKKAGHEIAGVWVRQLSEHGRLHRTMQYQLIRERSGDGFDTLTHGGN